jgi:solute carrier family 35 protein E1
MFAGFLIFLPLWLLNIRERPFINKDEFFETLQNLKVVALYNTLTHSAGVIALGSGAVSFTQVVKAAEPLTTAIISFLFQSSVLNIKAYLSLIPVIIGVALSSANELTFSWYCLIAGLIANLFASARGVFGKTAMCKQDTEKCSIMLSAENFYAVLTIMSSFMLIPLMIFFEGSKINQLLIKPTTMEIEGIVYTMISGLLFYLYNEVSFKVLNEVHPVTHALANTFKRIVIILSSILVFKNPITLGGMIGSSLAVFGVTLYSLVSSSK